MRPNALQQAQDLFHRITGGIGNAVSSAVGGMGGAPLVQQAQRSLQAQHISSPQQFGQRVLSNFPQSFGNYTQGVSNRAFGNTLGPVLNAPVQFGVNNFVKPIATLANPQAPPLDRAMGGIQAGLNTAFPEFTAGWQAYKSILNAKQAGMQGKPVLPAYVKGFTGQESPSLGDVYGGKNPLAKGGLNALEFVAPFMMGKMETNGKSIMGAEEALKEGAPLLSPTREAASSQAQKGASEQGRGVLGGLKYVDTSPLQIIPSAERKGIAQNIRDAYSGSKNLQTNIPVQLAAEVRKIVPNAVERQAVTFLQDVGGNVQKLQQALADPAFAQYRPAIEKALTPTPQMTEALSRLQQYYKETGQVGQQYGFLNELRDNYVNRIYKPEDPKVFVNTEAQRAGLPQSTSHGKARYYETLFDAIKAGKQPATLDSADLLSVHGQEFAKVLTNNKLYGALEQAGLGGTFEQGRLPAGYSKVGQGNFGVPDWLNTGLKAITEPNFINKINELRGLQKYQGLVKTIDLSVSLFHHFTMAMQGLYQTKFGLEVPKVIQFARSADFNAIENDGIKHTLMTANIDANKDILRSLSKGNTNFDKLTQLPGIKQGFQAIEANNEFLFGKLQRWLKVMDYGTKVSSWIGKHPGATNEEIILAKRGFAREINAAYGGLNWESLGKTPSFQGISRLLLLAPDWTYSNIELFKQAASKGTAGSAARSHVISALVGGAILTEGLNKLLTGHYTNENAKGHETEVEVRPGVYVSFFRGGIGDALKLASFTKESGPLQGASRFAQGKMSPLARTATGIASGVDYLGNPIYPVGGTPTEKTIAGAKFLGSSALPVPFSTRPVAKLAGKKNTDPLSYALVGTGVARPGSPSTPQQLQKEKYFDSLTKAGNSLNPNEQKIFTGIIHPTTKDASGNSIVDKNVYTGPDKYETFLAHPNLLAVERNFQQNQPNHDPLWDLTPAQLRAYMQAQVISKNDPTKGFKTEDTTVSDLYKLIPQGFYEQRQGFFNDLAKQGLTSPSQMPTSLPTPSEVSAFWSSYSQLPYGTGARSAALRTPQGQQALQFLQQQQQFTNAQRADMGLPLLSSAYDSSSSSKGYGSRGRKPRKIRVGSLKNFGGKRIARVKRPKAPKISLRSSKARPKPIKSTQARSITNYQRPQVYY